MRAYEIALLIAMFTAVSGVINDIGFMESYEIPIEQTGYTEDDFEIMNGQVLMEDDTLFGAESIIGSSSLFAAVGRLDDYVLIKPTLMRIFASNLEYEGTEYVKINNIANIKYSASLYGDDINEMGKMTYDPYAGDWLQLRIDIGNELDRLSSFGAVI